MGTLIDIIQSLQFDVLQVLIAGILLFGIGHLSGKRKVRRLNDEICKLEQNVMELNSELLYGTGQEATVINFKKSPEKKKVMAH